MKVAEREEEAKWEAMPESVRKADALTDCDSIVAGGVQRFLLNSDAQARWQARVRMFFSGVVDLSGRGVA